MKSLDLNDVVIYVRANIGNFHKARLDSLQQLKLKDVLKKKNPYLFKAKNILTGYELVKTLLDAYLSSQEESLFGEFLEGLAIFICGKVYAGQKSAAEGIDLQFDKNGESYVVTIKSGPNWGNSGQIKNMKDNFKRATKILKTNNPSANVVAINGCCYGTDNKPNKGDYQKLCGQRFWEFISGDERLYIDIVEPVGHEAKRKNEEFQKLYSRSINRFERQVLQDFVTDDLIDWEKLVRFNSGYRATRGGSKNTRR